MDLMWFDGHLIVAGPDTSSFVWMAGEGVVTTGLRFAPGAAPNVLGAPAYAVRDSRVRLDELWSPAEVRRLEEQVAATPSAGRALEDLVVAHGRGPARADPLVTELVRRVVAGERIAAIGPAVGLSNRQLQRRAHDAFGYGPKVLGRILRLDRALDLARTGARLADVAARCGYADQPHFAADVRALTGTSITGLGIT